MDRLKFVVLKNALSNLVRGGASSVVALVLPHYLAGALSQDRYSAWVLMLQIAAFANFLDFGVQTGVARFSAQAAERADGQQLNRIVNSAVRLLSLAGAFAECVAVIAVWQIPHIFAHAPVVLLGELRGGILLLSASSVALLPLSSFSGLLIGLHRNEFPALAIGSSRLAGAIGVLILLRFTQSLVWFALCIGAFNLLGGIAQLIVSRHLIPELKINIFRATDASTTGELLKFCLGLTGFNFAMLLVGGLDVTIVGHFAFAAAGYYGVAGTVVGFVTGLSSSVFTALMAPMAVMQERKEPARITDLILSSTRLGSYGNLILVVLTVLMGRQLLTLWVGQDYADKAFPILLVLVCAQAIRLLGSGFSIALVATGHQRQGVAGAMAEGICNLVVSIIAARLIGPLGVALGTLIGAICGISWVALYTMPRVGEITVRLKEFVFEGVLRPLLCFFPLILFLIAYMQFRASYGYLFVALLLSGFLITVFGRISWIRA